MKIEIWSDFVCPFCYIGKRRLEDALRQFKHRDAVENIFRSFELEPHAKKKNGMDIYDKLAGKYGMTRAQAQAMTAQTAELAREAGLEYHFASMIPANTYDAHRLTHYAYAQGKGDLLVERLLKAFFTDSLDIADRPTLALLAADAGLDREKAFLVLSSDEYGRAVLNDRQEADRRGIRGVPYFLFNGRHAVSGAQPVEVFVRTLEKAWYEERFEAGEGASDIRLKEEAAETGCLDGSCKMPE